MQSFEDEARKMARFIEHYNARMRSNELPVLPSSEIQPGYLRQLLPEQAPEEAESFDELLCDINDKILPGVTNWHHPNFCAYYPTGTSYESILGDMLSGGLGCVGFSWVASPACTELEVIMLDWMVHAMHLPKKFLSTGPGGGCIQDSASSASLMMILATRSARIRSLSGGGDSRPGALIDRMVVYASDQAHSSVFRAADIALIQVRKIPTTAEEGYTLNANRLRKAVEDDISKGLIPLICFATLGTTNSCAFDDLSTIGPTCNEVGMWCHVDAAYAGMALICPEFRHLANGLEYADSFNYNAHKLQRVNFDCSLLWVGDSQMINNAFIVNATYLNTDFVGMPEFRHWQIPLGRRFRALKLWFVLRMIGLEGLRKHVRKHVDLARKFAALLRSDPRFEIVNNAGQFGLVCFRLKGSNEVNRLLKDSLFDQRKIFLVAGQFPAQGDGHNMENEGVYFLRFVACSHMAQETDISHAFSHICETADKILQ